MTAEPDANPADQSQPTDPTDAELIEACLEGSDAAWHKLVDRYARLVYSVPARLGLPHDLRDEVFQTVWTIAVRHLASLRDAKSLPAWLIQVTQRESWRAAKAAKRARGAAIPSDIPWSDSDEAEALEDRQRVREALGRLGPRCRELLLALFHGEQLDYEGVARKLGIPRGSIGPTRARCLGKLRELMVEPARKD